MFDFKNMKVGKKIRTGFAVVLGLLILVAGVAYFALSNSSDGVARYRAIARNTNILGQVQSNLLMVRMNVKNFLITSDPKIVDTFQECCDKTGALLTEGLAQIKNPERVALLKDSEDMLEKYHAAFGKVVEKQGIRDDRVKNAANVYGPKMEKALTEILTTARRDGDMNAAYSASQATRSLLLGRLYVMKYLESNADADAARVKSEFEDMGGHLDTLDRGLQNRERRALLAQVVPMRKAYTDAFEDIVAAITERNKVVKGTMDVVGPEIADTMEKIKLEYKAEQDTLGPQLMVDNRNATVLAMVVSLLAIVFGLLMARKVAKMIVDPLSEMVTAANGLAQGDTSLRVEADSEDEIGELAGAFSSLIQAEKTLAIAAEAVGQGDLEVRVEPRSGKDTMGMALKEMVTSLKDADRVVRKQAAYQAGEVDKLIHNLEKVARGDLDVNLAVAEADADTQSFRDNFVRLNNGVEQTVGAIRRLADDTLQLAEAAVAGKLDRRADASRHGGDYARIVGGVNETLEAILKPIMEAAEVLERLAERDLTARVMGDYRGDHAKIKNSCNMTAEALHDAMQQVALAVDQVAAAGNQIASSSQAVAEGASEQASSLEETSSSLEEMASMTRQNADNAQQADAMSREAGDVAEQGGQAMGQMSEAMKQIRQAAVGTSAIIRDINEIAFQTNLLALNAAVEAARAGEAGRGFAVVAEEVRNLALRSKDAAKKTEDLINESVALSEGGEKISVDMNEKLSKVTLSIEKVGGIIGEIASASQEQARGIEQVNKAVAEMDKVTQQNAANSEESSSASEELASQAQELMAMVNRFRLENTRKNRSTAMKRSAPLQPQDTAESKPRIISVTKGKPSPKNGQSIMLRPEDIIPMEGDPDFKDF